MLLEPCWFPDLKTAAGADERNLLADAGMLDQCLRKDDPAFAVERQLLGLAKHRTQRLMLVRKFRQTVETFGDILEPVVSARVEGLELGRGEDDDTGEALSVQRSAKGGRDGDPSLPVYLVEIRRRKQRQRRIPNHVRDNPLRPGRPHARRPAGASVFWD